MIMKTIKKKWEEENGRKNGWRGIGNGADITPPVVVMETAEDGKQCAKEKQKKKKKNRKK